MRPLRVPSRWLGSLLAVAALSGAAPLSANEIRPIGHGREVAAEAVGPEVFGPSSGRRVPGASISDAKIPPYAVRVAEPRTYDGYTVTAPHLLIEDVEIDGSLDISTRLPVVLRRVIVAAGEDLPWLVLVRPGAGPLHVLWSDIGGAVRRRSAAPHVVVALALRGEGARVHRSRIGAAADGIQIAARDIRVTECLIANLLSRPGDHNDAIQLFEQAAAIELARNRIENIHPQTSAITVLGRDVAITSNLIAGGGWTVYGGALRNGKGGEGATSVRVEDNVFSRAHFPRVGTFGPVVYWQSSPGSGNLWRRNRDEQDRPIAP
jgi:hypothetical protein